MNTCPKCEFTLEEKTAVCDCGAILFGEVTNVSGWETETVFRVAQNAKKRVFPAVAVTIAFALALLALSWPRLGKNLVSGSETAAITKESVAQTPIKSDLVPSDDQLESDIYINGDERSSAFEFIAQSKTIRTMRRPNANPTARSESASISDAAAETNSLDAELLRDLTKIDNLADPAERKPEVSTLSKSPVPQSETVDASSQKKTSVPGYILGPRGGCFIVTTSGGKKYVDRAMCNSSAAAARQ